ncbi:jg22635, partial [Pararge aegeria aegeria]
MATVFGTRRAPNRVPSVRFPPYIYSFFRHTQPYSGINKRRSKSHTVHWRPRAVLAVPLAPHRPLPPQSAPLTLELELPVLRAQPQQLDLGFVSDGGTSKGYFTVAHSSRATVELVAEWCGAPHFRLHPRDFGLERGARARLYVQYTARFDPKQ